MSFEAISSNLLRLRLFRLLLTLLIGSALVATGCDDKSSSKDDDSEESEKDDEEEGDDDDDDDKSKKKKSKKKKKEEGADGPIFTFEKPEVGDKRTETKTEDSNMEFEVNGKKVTIVKKKNEIVEEEVLAIGDDGVITKKRVKYVKFFEREDKSGKVEEGAKPVEGKTYIVERKGDEVVVTAEGGGTVPADEEKIVKKDNKSLGKPQHFEASIPNRPLKKGERVTEMELGLQADFTLKMVEDAKDGKSNTTFEGVKVTFRGMEGELGLFDVEMTMNMERPGLMTMKFPFKGVFKLRQNDAWPNEMTVSAKLTVSPPSDGGTDMTGSGTMNMKSVYTY